MNDKYDASNMTKREDAYIKLFGEPQHIWHEKSDERPHIDIYCFKPGIGGRDFYTLVTAGMSDIAMKLPSDMPQEMRMPRVELVFYCSEPKTEYAEFLRRLAHYVFDNDTWFGMGHTMETSNTALLQRDDIDALLFLLTPVIPEDSLPMRLDIEGDPVPLLWVIPITAQECAMARQGGYLQAAMGVFNKNGRPYVFRPAKAPSS